MIMVKLSASEKKQKGSDERINTLEKNIKEISENYDHFGRWRALE